MFGQLYYACEMRMAILGRVQIHLRTVGGRAEMLQDGLQYLPTYFDIHRGIRPHQRLEHGCPACQGRRRGRWHDTDRRLYMTEEVAVRMQ